MFERACIVLVTGSRFWDNHVLLKNALDQVVADAVAEGYPEFVLRHGAHEPPFSKQLGRRPFQSADYLAHLWFRHTVRAGMPIPVMTEQARPADWAAPCRPSCPARGHRRERGTATICPAAGVYRNKDMVLEDPRPTSGVAFTRDNSGGTRHCVNTMREFSIPVTEIEYRSAA